MEWKSIDTAPKDGTWIIVQADGGQPSTARWNTTDERWENAANMLGFFTYDSWPVDLWMSQPPPIESSLTTDEQGILRTNKSVN